MIGELFRSTYGVLQGGVISPLLFKLYIEDMQENFVDVVRVIIGHTGINHLLQAGEFVLIALKRTGLESLFDRLKLCCRRWHTIIKIGKTTEK